MKRKSMKNLILALTIMFLLTGSAFAQLSYDAIYMTDSSGSHDEKTSFGLNETPWLYLKLPDLSPFPSPFPNVHVTGFVWRAPGSETLGGPSIYPASDALEEWYQFPGWDNIKQIGTWDLAAKSEYVFPSVYAAGYTPFTVTPEPVSSVLFLIGGAALTAGVYRKKRFNA